MKALDNKVRAQRIYKNHMKKILLSNNDKHDPSKKSSSILSKKAHELLKPGSRIEVHESVMGSSSRLHNHFKEPTNKTD